MAIYGVRSFHSNVGPLNQRDIRYVLLGHPWHRMLYSSSRNGVYGVLYSGHVVLYRNRAYSRYSWL